MTDQPKPFDEKDVLLLAEARKENERIGALAMDELQRIRCLIGYSIDNRKLYDKIQKAIFARMGLCDKCPAVADRDQKYQEQAAEYQKELEAQSYQLQDANQQIKRLSRRWTEFDFGLRNANVQIEQLRQENESLKSGLAESQMGDKITEMSQENAKLRKDVRRLVLQVRGH